MASRSPRRKQVRRVRAVIVVSIAAITIGCLVWQSYHDRDRQRTAPRETATSPARGGGEAPRETTIVDGGELGKEFGKAIRDLRRRYANDPAAYLAAVIDLAGKCGDMVPMREFVEEAVAWALRADDGNSQAQAWRLRLAIEEASTAGKGTRIASAWKAVERSGSMNLAALQAYLPYLAAGDDSQREQARKLLVELGRQPETLVGKLLQLETEFLLRPVAEQGALRQQVLAMQRRLPEAIGEETLLRVVRLMVRTDKLLIADGQRLVPAGVLRARRLLERYDAGGSTAMITEQLRLVFAGGDWATAIELGQRLQEAKVAASERAETRELVAAANEYRGRFFEAAALLMQWRSERESEAAAMLDRFGGVMGHLAAGVGEGSWQVKMLWACAFTNAGRYDSSSAALVELESQVAEPWRPFWGYWLGEARWRGGRMAEAAAVLQEVADAAGLAVWCRERARGYLLRAHLMQGDIEAASRDLIAMEGIVQSNRPLDEAAALVALARKCRGDAEVGATGILRRLSTGGDRRRSERFRAAFAAAENNGAYATEVAARLVGAVARDPLDWAFFVGLAPITSAAAAQRCRRGLSLIEDDAVRARLELRLQREEPMVEFVTYRILAGSATAAGEARLMRYELALDEGAPAEALAATEEPLRKLVARLHGGDFAGAEAVMAALPAASMERLVAWAELGLALGRERSVLERLPADASAIELRELRMRAKLALGEGANSGRALRRQEEASATGLMLGGLPLQRLLETADRDEVIRAMAPATPRVPAWLLPLLMTDADGRLANLAYMRLHRQLYAVLVLVRGEEWSGRGLVTLPSTLAEQLAENKRDAARAQFARAAATSDLQNFEHLHLARAAVVLGDETLALEQFSRAVRGEAAALPSAGIAWLRWAAQQQPAPDVLGRLPFAADELPVALLEPAAALAVARGDGDAAMGLLAKLPTTNSVDRTRAKALALNDPSAALQLCNDILVRLPGDAETLLVRAGLRVGEDEFIGDLDRAIRSRPDDAGIRLRAAGLAIGRSEYRLARRLLEPLIKKELTYWERRQLCGELIAADDWRNGARVLASFGGRDVAGLAFRQAFVAGDRDGWRRLHRSAAAIAKADADLAVVLLRAAWEAGRAEDAKLVLRLLPAATAGEPPELLAARLLGGLAAGVGDAESLAAMASEARWIALAAAEVSTDGAAVERLVRIALAGPDEWRLSDLRSACRVAAKWRLRALDNLLLSVASEPRFPDTLRASVRQVVGQRYLAEGFTSKAAEWLTDSVRLEPTTARRLFLAQALAASGEELRAEEVLAKLERSEFGLSRGQEAVRDLIRQQRDGRDRRRRLVAPYLAAGGIDAAAELLLSLPSWEDGDLRSAVAVVAAQMTEDGNWELAWELLSRLRRSTSLPPAIVVAVESALAKFSVRDGDLAAARMHLVRALTYREDADLYLQLASVCDEMGWASEAGKHRRAAALLLIPQ